MADVSVESLSKITLSRREAIRALLGSAVLFSVSKSVFAASSPDLTVAGDWNALTREFLLAPNLIYLDHAAAGTSPRAVIQKVEESNRLLETHPSAMAYSVMVAVAEKTRSKLAALINCTTNELALTHGTTHGMSLLAQGVPLKRGDRVLVSDYEAQENVGTWRYAARRAEAMLDRIVLPSVSSEEEILARFASAIKPETRIISVSHITNAAGFKMPVAALAKLAHAQDCLLIVDGAQAVGITPVDVKALGCDAYAFSGHKWLMGPKGTGGIYINRDARAQIAPISLEDGYGVYTPSTGIQNLGGMLGLGTAVDWLNTIGHARVHARAMQLREQLYAGLKPLNVTLVSPESESSMATPIIGFNVPETKYRSVLNALEKQNIAAKQIRWQKGVDFRVSGHLCNTEAQIARFIECVGAATA